VELVDEALLDAADPEAAVVPTLVEGELSGLDDERVNLAIAVNGRIEAVAESFRAHGKTRFSAFVPERSLLAGRNAVDVFVVVREHGRLVLLRLRNRSLTLTLREGGGPQPATIDVPSTGDVIHVYPRALEGSVRARVKGTGVTFTGRAYARRSRVPVHSIAVFVGNRSVYVGSVDTLRPNRVLGQEYLGKFGFSFELPRSLLAKPGSGTAVRVFAIRSRTASELDYGGGYPWATG
jgi:hypothetical protein